MNIKNSLSDDYFLHRSTHRHTNSWDIIVNNQRNTEPVNNSGTDSSIPEPTDFSKEYNPDNRRKYMPTLDQIYHLFNKQGYQNQFAQDYVKERVQKDLTSVAQQVSHNESRILNESWRNLNEQFNQSAKLWTVDNSNVQKYNDSQLYSEFTKTQEPDGYRSKSVVITNPKTVKKQKNNNSKINRKANEIVQQFDKCPL